MKLECRATAKGVKTIDAADWSRWSHCLILWPLITAAGLATHQAMCDAMPTDAAGTIKECRRTLAAAAGVAFRAAANARAALRRSLCARARAGTRA